MTLLAPTKVIFVNVAVASSRRDVGNLLGKNVGRAAKRRTNLVYAPRSDRPPNLIYSILAL
jgi:hypothetical protein